MNHVPFLSSVFIRCSTWRFGRSLRDAPSALTRRGRCCRRLKREARMLTCSPRRCAPPRRVSRLLLAVATAAQAQTQLQRSVRRRRPSRARPDPTVAEATKHIMGPRRCPAGRAFTLPLVSVGVTNATLEQRPRVRGECPQRGTRSHRRQRERADSDMASWAMVDQARDQIDVATTTADVRQSIAVAGRPVSQRDRRPSSGEVAQRRAETSPRTWIRAEAVRGRRREPSQPAPGGGGSGVGPARVEVTSLALRAAQEALGVVLAANGPVDAAPNPHSRRQRPRAKPSGWRPEPTCCSRRRPARRRARRRDSWKDNVRRRPCRSTRCLSRRPDSSPSRTGVSLIDDARALRGRAAARERPAA